MRVGSGYSPFFGAVIGTLLLALLAGCSAPATRAAKQPGGRFYTWMDAQGRLHTDALPGEAPAPAEPVVTPQTPAPAVAGAQGATGQSSAVASVTGSAPAPATVGGGTPSAAAAENTEHPEVFAADNTFVDSDLLERKHFNLEDKKKFAYVPDANGTSHIVYFEAGQGQEAAIPKPAAPTADDVHWATVSDASQLAWLPPGGCCTALLSPRRGKPELLALDRSYRIDMPSALCLQPEACSMQFLKLPEQKSDYVLRLQSFMSQSHCKRCLQWPRVLVLNSAGEVLRSYEADLGGYHTETWHSYASFYYAMDMRHATDRYLVLLPPATAGMSYKNKSYTFTENGEFAFSLVK